MKLEELYEVEGVDWPKVDRNHRVDLIGAVEAMPFTKSFKMTFLGLATGQSIVWMPPVVNATFDGTYVMGGITGALADVAAVSAATSTKPSGVFASTKRFEVDLIVPASGTLIAVGMDCGTNDGMANADVYVIQERQAVRVATCEAQARFSK